MTIIKATTVLLLLSVCLAVWGSVRFQPLEAVTDPVATETFGTMMNRWSRAPGPAGETPIQVEKRQASSASTCDSKSCPGIPIDLTQSQQTTVLDAHNSLRRDLTKPAPLQSLPDLTWDSQLAAIWKSHPLQCNFAHTTNEWRSNIYANATSRPSYPNTYVGENLAYYAQFTRCTGDTIDTCQKVLSYDLNNLLYGWGAEKACYSYSKVGSDSCNKTCYQQLYSDGCGHYTQQIWDDSTRVGCLVLNCTQYDIDSRQYGFILVCNYAPGGNYYGSYPYSSSVSGSKRGENMENPVHEEVKDRVEKHDYHDDAESEEVHEEVKVGVEKQDAESEEVHEEVKDRVEKQDAESEEVHEEVKV